MHEYIGSKANSTVKGVGKGDSQGTCGAKEKRAVGPHVPAVFQGGTTMFHHFSNNTSYVILIKFEQSLNYDLVP